MAKFFVKPNSARPDFRDVAKFLWGEHVNFDSDGDCRFPSDREWTELTLEHRGEVGQRVDVDPVQQNPLILKVRSEDYPLAKKTAEFLAEQTKGTFASEVEGL